MDDIKQMKFEQALSQLDSYVAQMEKGELPLDAMLATYERAHALWRHCEALLNAAKLRIQTIEQSVAAGDDGNGETRT